MNTPDTTERRGAIRVTAALSPARWKRRDRNGRSKRCRWPWLQTSDTSRQARNRLRVRRSLPRLFAVSGVWLDDWTAPAGQEPKVAPEQIVW